LRTINYHELPSWQGTEGDGKEEKEEKEESQKHVPDSRPSGLRRETLAFLLVPAVI
jgi:hypothetical protein